MEVFEYINSFPLFGSGSGYKPGLQRIKKLLNYLGNPQQDLNIIHLAGTNGKGSTAAILERIYREAGYKTGLYSSPHIFHFNERIKINGRACSTYQLTEIVKDIKKAVEEMEKDGFEISFFELVTALAFQYFKEQNPDLVILETGLGGRLDATNIVEDVLLSIITNISLEHSHLLGDTLTEIAAEKAGIIKKQTPIITAAKQKSVIKVLKTKAQSQNSKFIDLDKEFSLIESSGSLTQNLIKLRSKKAEPKEYQLSLLGQHQARNTALALRSISELEAKFPVAENEIKKALKDIVWPGRMQMISQKPIIILDAAHNPAAFKELVNNIDNSKNEFENLFLVFSILADKDLTAILKEFKAKKLKPEFYLAANKSFRSISTKNLAQTIEAHNFNFKTFSNLAKASKTVLKKAGVNDLIIAAGSFNTVFEAGIELRSKKIRGEKNE
ncbi:MAG: bifunctional folylpolyglutamate synthase/dihydrofolate synthase [Bacillota bacterium]